MRNIDLQETINLLIEALKEYKEASCLSNKGIVDNLRTRVQCILSRLPDEYLYINSKDVYFNDAFIESDMSDIIEELKNKLVQELKKNKV